MPPPLFTLADTVLADTIQFYTPVNIEILDLHSIYSSSITYVIFSLCTDNLGRQACTRSSRETQFGPPLHSAYYDTVLSSMLYVRVLVRLFVPAFLISFVGHSSSVSVGVIRPYTATCFVPPLI